MLFYFICYLLDIKFETFINFCWTLNLIICKTYMKQNSNKFLFWQSKKLVNYSLSLMAHKVIKLYTFVQWKINTLFYLHACMVPFYEPHVEFCSFVMIFLDFVNNIKGGMRK
jgi:uncharacterized Tic20 family protein